jgi:hypothetical protein
MGFLWNEGQIADVFFLDRDFFFYFYKECGQGEATFPPNIFGYLAKLQPF